jgi:hypothetical protein
MLDMCLVQLEVDWFPVARDGDITGGSAHFPANLIRSFHVVPMGGNLLES